MAARQARSLPRCAEREKGKPMSEIVKVQVPLTGDGPALIYDKARKHTVQRQLLGYERKQMRGDLKAYFKASWSSVVGWGLTTRVGDESW